MKHKHIITNGMIELIYCPFEDNMRKFMHKRQNRDEIRNEMFERTMFNLLQDKQVTRESFEDYKRKKAYRRAVTQKMQADLAEMSEMPYEIDTTRRNGEKELSINRKKLPIDRKLVLTIKQRDGVVRTFEIDAK